jgi:hypothetical protein
MKKHIKKVIVASLFLLAVTSVYALNLEQCLQLNAGHCSCDINGDNCRIFYIEK